MPAMIWMRGNAPGQGGYGFTFVRGGQHAKALSCRNSPFSVLLAPVAALSDHPAHLGRVDFKLGFCPVQFSSSCRDQIQTAQVAIES